MPWDILPLVEAAVTRRFGYTGQVYGADQAIPPYDALLAVTRYGAYQLFEETSKGSLEAGKLADLVVLDRNPLKVPPTGIRTIRVIETIKDGETVFKAGE